MVANGGFYGRLPGYLDIVGVARAVCVSVVSVGCGVFYVRGVDGDSSGLLLGCIVNVLVLFEASTAGVGQH